MSGEGAQVKTGTSDGPQRNKRLEIVFATISITTTLLGAIILAFPDKVAYLAFGDAGLGTGSRLSPATLPDGGPVVPVVAFEDIIFDKKMQCPVQAAYVAFGEGVVTPTADTRDVINKTVEQAKHGEIPSISLQPGAFLGIPKYKLDVVYEVELSIIGAALLGASLASYLLQRAAGANRLDHKTYKRLNLGLTSWAALSLGLSLLKYNLWKPPAILAWSAVLANVLIVTVPLLLQQNPPQVLCNFATEMRDIRTRRGAIYAFFALFFFVEGVGILLMPNKTLKAATSKDPGPIVNLLWQLVAASAHIIVPIATYNLKSAADAGNLTALTNFIQNAILFVVAFVHIIVLSKAASTGNAGPIGPVLLTAWSSAFAYSLYNFPAVIEGQS